MGSDPRHGKSMTAQSMGTVVLAQYGDMKFVWQYAPDSSLNSNIEHDGAWFAPKTFQFYKLLTI